MSDFISIRSNILEKANGFARLAFDGRYLFTVHIRGTDWSYAEPTGIQHYFDGIEKIIDEKGLVDYQVFLATDQVQFVDQFRAHFGCHLITYDSARGSSFIAPFKLKSVDNYKKGEDVLIDILLLAKGDHILKCAASVGEYATWFAPNIGITDFALESKYVVSRSFFKATGFEKLSFVSISPFEFIIAITRYITNNLEILEMTAKNSNKYLLTVIIFKVGQKTKSAVNRLMRRSI